MDNEHDIRLVEPHNFQNPGSPIFQCMRCGEKSDHLDRKAGLYISRKPCRKRYGRENFHLIDVVAPHG